MKEFLRTCEECNPGELEFLQAVTEALVRTKLPQMMALPLSLNRSPDTGMQLLFLARIWKYLLRNFY